MGDGAEAALWLVHSLFLYPALNKLIIPSSTLYASHSDKKVFLMDNFFKQIFELISTKRQARITIWSLGKSFLRAGGKLAMSCYIFLSVHITNIADDNKY